MVKNVLSDKTQHPDLKQRIKDLWTDWRYTILILSFVLIISLLLRIIKIFIGQQPVFADEAIYVRWAQVMKAEPTLRFLPLSDGKQPLYMWILMFLLKPGFDALVTGRVLSAVFGVFANFAVFVLAYTVFRSKKVGLVAALLYAVSPFMIFFESMALVDSTLTMLGIWFFIFLYIALKSGRSDLSMMAGILLGLTLLTKSPALYFSVLTPLVVFTESFEIEKKERVLFIFKRLILLIPVFLIGYVMYNILRLGPNFHLIGTRNADYVFPLSHLWLNPKDPFIFHIKEICEWLWMLGPGVLVFLIILGTIVWFKKLRKKGLVLFLWILFPLFANAMYAKVFTARYILFVMPFIYIISALFIVFKTKYPKLIYLLLALFVANSLLINYLLVFKIEEASLPKSERTGYLEEWTAGYGNKEIADYIIKERGILNSNTRLTNKKIVVGTEGYFGTLPDGLQIYLNNYPDVVVIGVGLDLKEIPNSLKESKAAGNKTYLVINASRLIGTPGEMGLKPIANYPRPMRTPGTHDFTKYGPRETLYFFEVK